MMQLGLADFEQLKKQLPINHDPALNAKVQRAGRRIAAVASKDMRDAQWEFVVFDSRQANAFCLPGGKVGVYTGILPSAKTDAGLARVMGHEPGHAVAQQQGEGKTPWFLSTHPVDRMRIENMRKLLPQAEEIFGHSELR